MIVAHQTRCRRSGGDPAAAAQLIGDLAAPLFEQAKRFGVEVIFVAPHALEASGENAIPQMLNELETVTIPRQSRGLSKM